MNLGAIIVILFKVNKKGQALLGLKANFSRQCQYMRGQRKENQLFKRLAGYKQSFSQICDPVPDHRSVSGLH